MNEPIEAPRVLNQNELPAGVPVMDAYTSAIKELFSIEHPELKREDPNRPALLESFIQNTHIPERFIYYPWRNVVMRTVDEVTYFKLRTARNRTIISESEQIPYRACAVGVVGLSVGSSAIRALVASGGPKQLKIADFDDLEITNLNRISAGLPDVGHNKTDITARYVWELDPDAQLELWREGVTAENLEQFITQPKLDVFVDEMDNLVLKFQAREICRKAGIPVVMATDNGDSVILDIERFDLEPEREFFHGLVPGVTTDIVSHMPFQEWLRIATKIVGPDFLTDRMQAAIMQIGRTIAAVPQLGPTAAMAGAGIAYAVRAIANKAELPSGRYAYGLDSTLVPGYNSPEATSRRQEVAEQMKAVFSKPRS